MFNNKTFFYLLLFQSRIEYVLCIEAANAALKKYYKDDVSGLMDCMDLGFHHLLKNLLKIRTSAIDNLKASEQEDMEVMDLALGSLDSRFIAHQRNSTEISLIPGKTRPNFWKTML